MGQTAVVSRALAGIWGVFTKESNRVPAVGKGVEGLAGISPGGGLGGETSREL